MFCLCQVVHVLQSVYALEVLVGCSSPNRRLSASVLFRTQCSCGTKSSKQRRIFWMFCFCQVIYVFRRVYALEVLTGWPSSSKIAALFHFVRDPCSSGAKSRKQSKHPPDVLLVSSRARFEERLCARSCRGLLQPKQTSLSFCASKGTLLLWGQFQQAAQNLSDAPLLSSHIRFQARLC